MSWTKILGNDRVKKILQKAILENRIAHAYLLIGIEGIGKDAIAIEFAKTVNCESPIINGETINACGVCHSCNNFKSLAHQNFDLIFSLPAGKGSDSGDDLSIGKMSDEQLKQISEQIQQKAQDNYHRISLPNANQIKVNSIREIKRKLTLTANSSGRRVILISRADELNQEAANAFLKTLEEPHENITIFLTSSRPEMMLNTISSRCQNLICNPIDDNLIADYIQGKFGKSLADSKMIAMFSQGSVTRAYESLSDNMQELRSVMIDTLRASLRKKQSKVEVLDLIDKVIDEKDRNHVIKALNILILWFRDVVAAINGMNEMIVNADMIETISKFGNNFKDKNYCEAINEVELAIFQVNRNVALGLVMNSLFIKLRKIFTE